jgi:hypothetical protein
VKIADIIARRTDLSTFLVHLTRTSTGCSGKNRLKSIILCDAITATSAFGPAARKMRNSNLSIESQKCVCFTETPLEHVSLLTAPIEGRRIKFEPYGIVITKKQGRKYGTNPVWYLDTTPGHNWLTNPLDGMIVKAIPNGITDPLFELTPFIEQFGLGKDFSWEREWRVAGGYPLPDRYILLCPEAEHQEFCAVLKEAGKTSDDVPMLDPAWGLETIIAKLAGFHSHEVGPIAEN